MQELVKISECLLCSGTLHELLHFIFIITIIVEIFHHFTDEVKSIAQS